MGDEDLSTLLVGVVDGGHLGGLQHMDAVVWMRRAGCRNELGGAQEGARARALPESWASAPHQYISL